MLRRLALITMAVVVSYGLAILVGYLLYLRSAGWAEAHLSIVVRFIANPLIALFIGAIVGFLSKDRPAFTAVIGLAPWVVLLPSPYKPVSISGWISWLGPILIYIPLGAIAAACAWRYRHRKSLPSSLA